MLWGSPVRLLVLGNGQAVCASGFVIWDAVRRWLGLQPLHASRVVVPCPWKGTFLPTAGWHALFCRLGETNVALAQSVAHRPTWCRARNCFCCCCPIMHGHVGRVLDAVRALRSGVLRCQGSLMAHAVSARQVVPLNQKPAPQVFRVWRCAGLTASLVLVLAVTHT